MRTGHAAKHVATTPSSRAAERTVATRRRLVNTCEMTTRRRVCRPRRSARRAPLKTRIGSSRIKLCRGVTRPSRRLAFSNGLGLVRFPDSESIRSRVVEDVLTRSTNDAPSPLLRAWSGPVSLEHVQLEVATTAFRSLIARRWHVRGPLRRRAGDGSEPPGPRTDFRRDRSPARSGGEATDCRAADSSRPMSP